MNNFQIELPKDKTSVWDLFVPLVTSGRITTAYITEAIDEPSLYNQLCAVLHAAYEGDEVVLIINSPGGMVDTAFMLIDAMKNSKAKITSKLSGTVASAATLIALHSDELVVADYTQWLSHNYSTGVAQSKGFELKTYVAFNDKELEIAFREIHAGFLTNEEIDDILEDKDVWLGAKDIRSRWAALKQPTEAEVAQ